MLCVFVRRTSARRIRYLLVPPHLNQSQSIRKICTPAFLITDPEIRPLEMKRFSTPVSITTNTQRTMWENLNMEMLAITILIFHPGETCCFTLKTFQYKETFMRVGLKQVGLADKKVITCKKLFFVVEQL